MRTIVMWLLTVSIGCGLGWATDGVAAQGQSGDDQGGLAPPPDLIRAPGARSSKTGPVRTTGGVDLPSLRIGDIGVPVPTGGGAAGSPRRRAGDKKVPIKTTGEIDLKGSRKRATARDGSPSGTYRDVGGLIIRTDGKTPPYHGSNSNPGLSIPPIDDLTGEDKNAPWKRFGSGQRKQADGWSQGVADPTWQDLPSVDAQPGVSASAKAKRSKGAAKVEDEAGDEQSDRPFLSWDTMLIAVVGLAAVLLPILLAARSIRVRRARRSRPPKQSGPTLRLRPSATVVLVGLAHTSPRRDRADDAACQEELTETRLAA